MKIFIRRASIALYFLTATSCSTAPKQWEFHESRTHIVHTNSARLIIGPELGEAPFELEIIRSSSGIRIYLNILRFEAPPHPELQKRTELSVTFGSENMILNPYVLKGGQRLLFPYEFNEIFFQTLLKGEKIKIKMGFREFKVSSSNFSASYESFLSVPLGEDI